MNYDDARCACCAAMPASEGVVADAVTAAPTSSADELEVTVSVKDGGMMLVTALTPDLRWQSGAAELSLHVHGSLSQPQVGILSGAVDWSWGSKRAACQALVMQRAARPSCLTVAFCTALLWPVDSRAAPSPMPSDF